MLQQTEAAEAKIQAVVATRTGFVARRSAQDLAPFRALENAVRDAAQEPSRESAE